ncbi:sensor histidine kinase [Pontibacter akesuensis]|uniref:histidine kinase n=1 Tax=Pontibacter akesuensis TaxID=388950 RepID=A0A1I7GMZ1_9BACT|nr:HAMP domain-containing sensor histidine kinase [Pontibacter akesuensis]GHA55934.1 histidine kinase [Pontibacter akesuensis]SFU49810.1 Histidine kinase-, DNA gyrase B-, and HSP90-like ATPase [Pontibacter akesuensis]
MGFKNFEGRLLLRVGLLLVTLSAPALLVVNGLSEALVFLLPLLAYQVVELVQFLRQAQDELNQFVESVHYRDFTRYFNEKKAPTQLETLRKGFNEINSTFKLINQEKETQHLHLQRILELVNTGILSYNLDSGEILLMNEALRKLLQVPFMKTVQALEKRDPGLYAAVQRLQPGNTTLATAHTSSLDKSTFKILLSAAEFKSEGHSYKLIAFQNVNEALDETEAQAWQKLLNVMTHELMNSIAPISSLANTLKARLHETATTGATPEDLEDLEIGISTIKRRSEGLLKFASTYRNLSKITKLNEEEISIRELFANLKRLMLPTLQQKQIKLDVALMEQDITLQADPNLLDQVFINLLVNAIEAVKDRPAPQITLEAFTAPDGKVVVTIADNGMGMSREVQEKIFIPFFSTKKQGSGIGLSLCKQILMLHRATIQVQSEEGLGTVFTLRFGSPSTTAAPLPATELSNA